MSDSGDRFKDLMRSARLPVRPDPERMQAVWDRVLLLGGERDQKPRPRRMTVWGAAIAAAVVLAAGASFFLFTGPRPAYAWEQTLEAVKSVRFLHVQRFDKAGRLEDERWIEMGANGYQVRYRQDSPGRLLVIEDGKTVMAYHRDKQTVVLNDRRGRYLWIANLGQFFRDLSGPGSMSIQENAGYRSRPAHRVRWLALNMDCYIDPVSRLPIALGNSQISYEEPPAGIFEIVMPKGAPVVDKRPGAPPGEEPQWMKDEALAVAAMEEGGAAFARGDWAGAAIQYAKAVELDPRHNWAWYWMGRARYELGDYPAAVETFTHVIGMFDDADIPHYCYLSRGLAYRKLGLEKKARADFGVALGVMVESLRHLEGTGLFDEADGQTRVFSAEERFGRMVARLREVAGEQVDGGGSTEAVIAAWEAWWKRHRSEYGVTSPG